MTKVDRKLLAGNVVKSLIGPVNGDEIPEHKIKVVAMVVAQTIDVLGEMGYLDLKELKEVMNSEQKEADKVSKGKNKK